MYPELNQKCPNMAFHKSKPLISSKYQTTFTSRLVFVIYFLFVLIQVNAKEIDSKTDLLQEESLAAEHRSYDRGHRKHAGQSQTQQQNYNDYGLTTSSNSSWPSTKPEVSQIKQLNVKCEKNHMRVHIEFDRPFYGLIFSKGHYNDGNGACVHLPAGSGHLTTNFDIFLGACGMTSSGANQGQLITQPGQTSGLYIENTIVIQYDPQVQEIYDQARKLRCTWYDYYEKSVSFRPFNVEMQDAVTANFLGDNIQCWMQIQVGKGPWASEVAGIVKIGQTMTMVLAIKDEENKFDMLVRNCIAHDGKHQPIQLVDEYGCVVRSKIMSKFQKVKNFGNSATVVSYAYFQAFKFPDTMNVHFQCVIQVCRYECPEPVCDGGQSEIQAASAGSSSVQHLLTAATQLQADYGSSPSIPKDSSSNSNIVIGKAIGNGASPVFPANLLLSRSGELKTSEISDNAQTPAINTRTPTEMHQSLAQRQLANLLSNVKPRTLKLMENANYTDSRNLTAKLIETGQLKLRSRRNVQFKNIPTEKMIQVVAPGDVAFAADIAVPLENVNEELIPEELRSRSVCISTIGFATGLLVLLCLLVVSSLVATFLYLRIRQISSTFRKQQYIPNTMFH